MLRLKEVSHFECHVRVLRNGFCRSCPAFYYWSLKVSQANGARQGRTVSSVNLVPGDVFEVSDPSLSQVPCDCLLLSGDCIVNESMLTGT